ncbi:hypothetical protein SGUI_0039 [Serinicoccus hydrothermalis]|uniref:Uncharacterized protein n=1 Tax=Serinicoccus hydrothermalis TaxID=1758689 RepID=A0A1B1N7R9_9MICO|nr:hypothetical protein [Serinicoccus hydrothermalis]ANS77435.1 hypothetical protein SGUI_0039 [Serinicoccus hydrothermalis]
MTDIDVRPTPSELGDLIEELVGSRWPTTEDDRLAWFDEHGLVVEDAECESRDGGSEAWAGSGPGVWGRPSCGWNTVEGELVGLFWFLWRGTSWEESERSARELRDLLAERFGDPTEEHVTEPGTGRFTAFWETPGHTIDLYLHGGMRPQGADDQFYDEPVIQLHLDHARAAGPAHTPEPRASLPAPPT